MTAGNPFGVEVGQTYRDRDARTGHRLVTVIEIDETHAVVTSSSSSRPGRIRLDRFNPKSARGFEVADPILEGAQIIAEPTEAAEPAESSRLRIGSLCSGYGGLDGAVETVFGAEPAWFCEYADAPSRILRYHYPTVPNHVDLTTLPDRIAAGDPAIDTDIDIITAGYPCQPFSSAGRRKGTDDERHLWPYVRETIRLLRPSYAVLENVSGHRSLGFDRVLGDLAEDGLNVRWTSVRASHIGAPHHRERLFIVASDPSVSDETASDTGGYGRELGAQLDRESITILDAPSRRDDSDRRAAAESSAADADGAAVGELAGESPAEEARAQAGDGPGDLGGERPDSDGRPTAADADGLGRRGGSDDACRREPDAARSSSGDQPGRSSETRSSGAYSDAADTGDDGRGSLGTLTGRHQPGVATAVSSDSVFSDSDRFGFPWWYAPIDAGRPPRTTLGPDSRAGDDYDWGIYGPAVRRWEHVVGPAPRPTILNGNGKPTLNPQMSEWMMGLPPAWITVLVVEISGREDIPKELRLSRRQALKAAGNGVCPLQAIFAIRFCLQMPIGDKNASQSAA